MDTTNAGSTGGLELEFGLGLARKAVLEIDWASGRHGSVDAQADQFLTIVETEGIPGDLDGDCEVRVPDLIILLGNWG